MKISVFYEHIAEAAVQTGCSESEIMKTVKSAGIQAVDIEAARLQNEQEVYRKLKEAGLLIGSIYSFFDYGHGQDVKAGFELIDLAVTTGAESVLVVPGFVNPGENRKVLQKKMKDAVSAICAYGEKKSITVLMEDFDNSSAPYATANELLSFMQEAPGLACAFDTGNFLFSEENAEEALELLLPYIKYVHLKDRSLIEKHGETPLLTVKGRRLYSSSVGGGCIPMDKICSRLLNNGYDGGFTIEHFGSQHQLEDIEKSVKWIKKNCIP